MTKGFRAGCASVRSGFFAFALATLTVSSPSLASKANNSIVPVPPRPPFAFSRTPSDEEFLRTGLFAEPLAPVVRGDTADNRDLAKALMAYKSTVEQSGAPDALIPIVRYLDSHPDSPWKPSLELNLGMIYRQTGHFSKALAVWQDGWEDTKNATDPHGQKIANALVARLSQLEAYLGRKELLSPLLDSIKDRPIGGSATQLITNSREGLYDMTFKPEESFRCGPLALKRILFHGTSQPSALAMKVLEEQSPSTDHGLSLTNVRDIAERAGMHYQAAFRSPGAKVIYPAVAHWNVGHYAALVDQQKGGRYLVQDTTFGEDIRISESTLNEESSGYFLIPQGPLPQGWRLVSDEEGHKIWGRGNTGNAHDGDATGCGCSDGGVEPTGAGNDPAPAVGGAGGGPMNARADTNTAPRSSDGVVTTVPTGLTESSVIQTTGASNGFTTSAVELSVVGLQLHDAPVGYTPPVGPRILFNLYYSQRDLQQQLTSLNYSNFGSRWTFTWLSYVTYDTSNTSHAQVYLRGGGAEPYTFLSGATTANGPYTQSTLKQTLSGSTLTGFTITHPDGSSEIYSQALANGATQTLYFMTAIKDKAGNTVTLSYDGSMRITSITDAIGQVTTLTYANSSYPLQVTKITDPFGRSASFIYSASGLLSSITDVLNITSSYTYGQGSDPDFINTLTTPYGNTTFVYGDVSTNSSLGSTRFIKTTDPLSRTSYVEFDNGVDPGDSSGGFLKNSSLLPAGMYTCNGGFLYWRNTFVWDANQYQLATASGGLDYSLAKVIHWHHSSDYTNAARTVESMKEPLENRVWYDYPGQSPGGCNNPIVFPVSSSNVVSAGASSRPSAVGRVLDSGATQLFQYQYNTQGNVTQYTDPAGRQWSYAYDTNGIDRLTTTNTTGGRSDLLETRTYNSQHLPLTIKGANGKTAHVAYNGAGQMTKYTDQLGEITTLAYDATGHLKSLQGPIAAAKWTLSYDANSRIASTMDPAGYTLHYTYDPADRLLKTTFPDGTSQQRAYTLLDLTKVTDRMNQATRYQYDAVRELTTTTDPAGNITRMAYSLAGALTTLTDPNSHITSFMLDAESRVVTKQFANATSMNIAYENAISRIAVVTDALSQTTNYTYNTDSSVATVSYTAHQATPGVTLSYDPNYPRPTSMTDGTGTTNYSYYAVSGAVNANQLRTVSSPVAGTSLTDTIGYVYDALNRAVTTTVNGVARSVSFDALGRQSGASNPLDTFTYGYSDGTSRITSVSSTAGPTAALTYFGTTGDDLLQQISYTTHSGGTSLAQFGYTYNADDLVKSYAVTAPAAQTTNYGYDAANRLTSGLIGTGTPQYQYVYDHASNLTSITPNGATQNYTYTATNAITAGSYDSNGSPTSLGGKTYKWDGANRIVSFGNSAASTASTFVYDGFGRLVRIVDTHAGAITADHSYTWCGATRCIAHDNTQTNSPVSIQYFDQGVIVGATPYYYTEDQLGNIAQLVSNTGSVASEYVYDPYGNRTTVSESVPADLGYAGYFYHLFSGLHFTLHRSYDSIHSRWLNRDPIGEAGGVNLYAYVSDSPLSLLDPSGLCPDEDKCERLADEMDFLVNSVRPGDDPTKYKGLAQRFRQHPRLPPSKIPGHAEQIRNRQAQLRDKIQEFIDSGCGDPPGFATAFANMPIPQDPSDANSATFTIDPPTPQQIAQGGAAISIAALIARALAALASAL